MLRMLFALLLALPLNAADATERWEQLPPTPAPATGWHRGYADINGIRLYSVVLGSGPPVVLLHGGLANSDYWVNQVEALAFQHTLLVDAAATPEVHASLDRLATIDSQRRCGIAPT